MSAAELHAGNVVSSISIQGLLTKRDAVVKLLRDARKLIAEAQQVADDARLFTREYRRFDWVVNGETRYRGENSLLTDEGVEGIVKRLDAQCWGKLMHDSGLMTFMDAKAKSDFATSVEECKTPDLTPENIETAFATLYAGRGDMFDQGVIRCFKALSWNYKTNNPVKFGKRIIIEYLHGSFHFSHAKTDQLDDLNRLFRLVDGKPEEDHRNGISSRLYAMNGPGARDAGSHVDEYMTIKWFKNGNGHITFTRPDLVDQLNSIIAKHYPGALPAARS